MKTGTFLSAVAALMFVMTPAMAGAETIPATEVTASDCKGNRVAPAEKTRAAEEGDISWSLSYADGVLTLTWHNLLATCCPQGFISNIEVEGRKIFFYASEDGDGGCDCLCYYDVTATYQGITPGHYELYFGGELVGEADIEEGFSGEFRQSESSVRSVTDGDSSLTLHDGKVIARSPGKFKVDVYNVTGTRIYTLEATDLLEISTLSGGVSLIRLTTREGKVSTLSVIR